MVSNDVFKVRHQGSYCAIKLHEVEKVVLSNLNFSSLVSFLLLKIVFSLYLACNP